MSRVPKMIRNNPGLLEFSVDDPAESSTILIAAPGEEDAWVEEDDTRKCCKPLIYVRKGIINGCKRDDGHEGP